MNKRSTALLEKIIREEPPQRQPIFTREEFAEFARQLAATHTLKPSNDQPNRLSPEFEESVSLITAVHREMTAIAAQKEPLTPGSEWLLDNFHLVEEQIRSIRKHLPRGFYRTLPKLEGETVSGLPRVYHLAQEFINHSDATVDNELLAHFISAYQSVSQLTIGELWAIPIMLRLALIRHLRRIVTSYLAIVRRNKLAEEILTQSLSNDESSSTQSLLSFAKGIERDKIFLSSGAAELLRQMRQRGASAMLLMKWFEERLRETGKDPDQLIRSDQQTQAANQITIGNTVTSLRTLASLDWHLWFERMSPVHTMLCRDPIGAYAKGDFTTRDHYRHHLELLARYSKKSELAVAELAVSLASKAAAERSGALSDADRRACHVGYYLIDEGRPELEKELRCSPPLSLRITRAVKANAFMLYIGLISICTLILLCALEIEVVTAGFPPSAAVFISIFFSIPISEIVIQVLQWAIAKTLRPYILPRYDFEKTSGGSAIPPECKTLVAVNALLHDEKGIRKLVEILEVRFLGNQDENIIYAILADLPDSLAESNPNDAYLLKVAQELIQRLNEKYFPEQPTRFFLLHRKRLWNSSESKYMGWERKRGKLSELNQLLLGSETTSFVIDKQSHACLSGVRFVLTLDTDSILPKGSAAKLIGALAHPLNRPIVDAQSRVVVKGYGILQPRIGTTITSSSASLYSRLYSGHAGLDPYTKEVSDLYQDLFHEGSFYGKGIYDLHAFEEVLRDRVPENTLLSHDLFEGLFARVSLASHIEFYDEFPSRLTVESRRAHRWVRGDWQVLPWIGGRIRDARNALQNSPISPLGQWKLIDNLRRSLIAPSVLASLVLAWLSPETARPLLIAIALSPYLAPRILQAIDLLTHYPWLQCTQFTLGKMAQEILNGLGVLITQIIFLPFTAFQMVHAITITLWRMYVSKKNLLEWQTAAVTEKVLGTTIGSFIREMLSSPVIALILGAALSVIAPFAAAYWAPFILGWVLAPVVAYAMSRPPRLVSSDLTVEDRAYLEGVAFSTWQYFDTFLDPSQNYLIPDNLQTVPSPLIAERTSPTNFGLSIMALISAYDFGFIPLQRVIRRTAYIFDSLAKLERYNGHFLNWYQTKTLASLYPRYISTVDSGNLVAFFVAARSAIKTFQLSPIISSQHIGFISRRLRSSLEKLGGDQDIKRFFDDLLRRLQLTANTIAGFGEAVRAINTFRNSLDEERKRRALPLDVNVAIDRVIGDIEPFTILNEYTLGILSAERLVGAIDPAEMSADNDRLIKIRDLLNSEPSLFNLSQLYELLPAVSEAQMVRAQITKDLGSTLEEFVASFQRCNENLAFLRTKVAEIVRSITQIVDEMDFTFLYDSEKKLFSIGYNLENARRDPSYYDLLASEARLSSFMAIARGQVPQEHWFMTNRSLTNAAGGMTLLSWSGTMFEYLMPLLVAKDFEGTLLAQSYRSVVKTQRLYAQRSGLPVWGISESAFSRINFEKDYQYKAFGVPDLGLKRGLADDMVISPYSTLLAVSIDPKSAIANLKKLEELKMRGEYGFFEAIDFTTERLSTNESNHVVASFFAHHQGMSFVALNNFLNNGIFQERFHADPLVKAIELLLHEKFPDHAIPTISRQGEVSRFLDERGELEAASRGEVLTSPHTPYPRTRLLSNGRLSAMVDNAGSGYLSMNGDISLTRWREDALINNCGYYIYLRDLDTNDTWSATYQPTRIEPDTYEVIFNPEKVEFRRLNFGILAHMDMTVSPEDNVEVRRLEIGNLSGIPRRIEVTSFAEVVLGSRRGDSVHPAFSKIFVESEFLNDQQALIFSRRKRSDSDPQLCLMHRMTLPIVWEGTQFESSREQFIGRGRSAAHPRAFDAGVRLSGTSGAVLDPVFSLRTVIELQPGETHQIGFVTGFTNSREDAVRLALRYQEVNWIQRAFELAWSHRNIELRQDMTSVAQMHVFEQLANGIIFNIPAYRPPAKTLLKNRGGQSSLWRLGISGDIPIVLVQLNDPEQISLAQELVKAHGYLRNRGLAFDLVIFNEYPGGYMQNFQVELEMMIRSSPSGALYDKREGVFLRNPQQVSSDELLLLQTVARIVLNGSQGLLRKQLRLESKAHEAPPTKKRLSRFSSATAHKSIETKNLECFNGIGGFDRETNQYRMNVSATSLPPLPWSNIIANEHFGFMVTESGGGYTWSENSREYRITPWSNDPISDRRGEVLYLRDTSTGAFWSPTPLPAGGDSVYSVNHGFGYSEFSCSNNNIGSVLTLSSSRNEKVKWFHLELHNETPVERTLEVYLFVDWVLGVEREEMFRYIQTGYDEAQKFLYATNYYNMDFPGRFAFMGTSEAGLSFTSNRREFLGRNGDFTAPHFFLNDDAESRSLLHTSQSRLMSNSIGIGNQPCGVLMVHITIPPRERYSTQFYIGEAATLDEARTAAPRYRMLMTRTAEFEMVKRYWQTLLNSVQVKTPVKSFDLMLNGWLLYQTLACRIMGRSAFYQSGGAIGFRDQLQDSMAMLYSAPEITRRQILLAASRMFPEGDVQHWWHPPIGRGIRTKISDNYLWLPYVISRYVEVTGDRAILDEQVGFIQGPPLEHGHMETMFIPNHTDERSTLYDHCIRALRRALMRGPHGLPLMGGGDWNDGMNLVGKDGLGESCWLGWFIIEVMQKFIPFCRDRDDGANVELYQRFISELKDAMEKNAWDGEWYRRAFYDDGTALGSSQNDECRIDSLAQSWGIISGAADPERVDRGFRKACEILVREKDNIIALLDPPFYKTEMKPGYIKGYLAGTRENGGQYTHAATWMILAAVLRGEGSRALKMFQLINPARISESPSGAAIYKGEPYVMCGDVYSVPPHAGRAGWSWYTGSSGWMYRVGIEYILGLKRGPSGFTIEPTISSDWKGYELSFNHNGSSYEVIVRNPDGVERGIRKITIDGKEISHGEIPYHHEKDGTMRVEVTMG